MGDRKACILRAPGSSRALSFRRAEADAACVLAGCLGPGLLDSLTTIDVPRWALAGLGWLRRLSQRLMVVLVHIGHPVRISQTRWVRLLDAAQVTLEENLQAAFEHQRLAIGI